MNLPVEPVICIRLPLTICLNDVEGRGPVRDYDDLFIGSLFGPINTQARLKERVRYLADDVQKTGECRKLP